MELYTPRPQELWFKSRLLGDEATMSYNHAYGGTLDFPPHRWESWYRRWITHHENKRFYRYVREQDTFLGEVAYHFDETRQIYLADVIIYAPHRRRGYGRRALCMLCRAAEENRIPALYDEIAIDNPSLALFLACGFREEGRTADTVLVKKDLHTHGRSTL